jgi:hypothetical protein
VYRDVSHAVRFLDLTPFAASFVGALREGVALGRAIEVACAALGTPSTPTLLADITKLLFDLGERGVLLGGVRERL